MLLDLSDVLTKEGKILETEIPVEIESVSGRMGKFSVIEKTPLSLRVSNAGHGRAKLEGKMSLIFATQCDRCLADVETVLNLIFDRMVIPAENVREDDEDGECMEGFRLNVDTLVQSEIIVNWPFKILCTENCKGICPKCGQNLNIRVCGCDVFIPDPRMAVLKDIFESNKEV